MRKIILNIYLIINSTYKFYTKTAVILIKKEWDYRIEGRVGGPPKKSVGLAGAEGCGGGRQL